MKKTIFALIMMLTAAVSASAMSYEQARNEALFLTDKMAYELNLTNAQYEAAYEINLDYLMGVTSVNDVFGTYWERRNLDLSYILYSWQWDAFRAATYFYRPLYWKAGYWHFGIYARYPHRDYFYFGRPHFYATYRGGHAWHRNGGQSFYHGRDHHFRPTLPQNRAHFGMRNSFDRGDFRGSRASSSTRITGSQNGHNANNRPAQPNRGNAAPTPNNGVSGNRNASSSTNRSNSGNFNRNSSSRPASGGSSAATRTAPSRSSGSGSVGSRPAGGGNAAAGGNRGHVGTGGRR